MNLPSSLNKVQNTLLEETKIIKMSSHLFIYFETYCFQDGDCLVCFSVSRLFSIAKRLMKLGLQPTVIYGALPPWTKLNQAKTFNEMGRPLNVMVATDAVGMGLNLNIRRFVLFICGSIFL